MKVYDIAKGVSREVRGADVRLLVTRSASAVTLFSHRGPPVRIILSTYASVDELLLGFDVDCSCCAYVLRTGSFVCSQRGRRALKSRVNFMESSRHSAAYVHRLEKYASHGFAVGLAGLDTARLAPSLLAGVYVMMRKHDLLLRVVPSSEDSFRSSVIRIPSKTKAMELQCQKQRAKIVCGIQRLAVLSFAKHIREIDPPYVKPLERYHARRQECRERRCMHARGWLADRTVLPYSVVFVLSLCVVFALVFRLRNAHASVTLFDVPPVRPSASSTRFWYVGCLGQREGETESQSSDNLA